MDKEKLATDIAKLEERLGCKCEDAAHHFRHARDQENICIEYPFFKGTDKEFIELHADSPKLLAR